METLELKDIAAYLPYGLVFREKGFGLFPQLANLLSAQRLIEKSRENIVVRPILRPMSDLTKEITHKEETFVPIISMIKCTNFFGLSRNIPNEWLDDDWNIAELVHNCEPSMCIALFDKLSEWMFDYRGLIPTERAVDVNTLLENPYEA